jgi:hypothetical protein
MLARLVALGLALVVILSAGCAYLKRTEQLPSPNPGPAGRGGPEPGGPGYME